jgi:23S rRNA (uracil1939-C5)-methyltransferase
MSITVNIRNLAFGGEGVGEVVPPSADQSLLGISAFIKGTIPGELVTADVRETKKRHVRAELLEILTQSPSRVAPACKHFGICGGCELQHIEYNEQLRLKTEMIRGALRAARLPLAVVEAVRPLLGSEPYGYRRRVTLHISEGGLIGFYRELSRSVVNISECEVATANIQHLIPQLQQFATKVRGKISSLILESDPKGVVAVLKSAYALHAKEKEMLLKEARELFDSALLLSGGESIGGYGRELLELPLNVSGTLTLQVPAGNFSQVNLEVNQQLIEYVIGRSGVARDLTVFDLYAGAGNFSLPLARAGSKVTAVELDSRLVKLGKQNALRYNFDRSISFIESSVEKFLNKESAVPDLIVADPPRSGLGAAASKLPKADRLVLISCHLPSCVRDLTALMELGYTVEEIQPFDMFAQTSYTEIVTVLKR